MELVSITQIECDTALVDDKLIDVNGICVSDDMVIFAHEKAEPLIQIFDRMNNKYIGGIGEKGKGPEEYQSIMPSTLFTTDNGFGIYDINSYREYQIIKNPNQISFELIRECNLPGGMYPLNHPFMLKDSVFVSMNIKNSREWNRGWMTCDFKTKKIEYKGTYPRRIRRSYKESDYWQIFHSSVSVSPTLEKFFCLYMYFDLIEVFDHNFTLLASSYGNKDLPDFYSNKEFDTDDIKIKYMQSYSTKSFIYGLYYNRSGKWLMENIEQAKPQVHVFDLNGKLINKFELDQVVTSIAVDNNDSIIYAVSPFDENRYLTYHIK